MHRPGIYIAGAVALAAVACVTAGLAFFRTCALHTSVGALERHQEDSSRPRPCIAAPDLGERMNWVARRFAGLWFAGRSDNRALASYELDEMEETIEGIEVLRPVENGVDVAGVLEALVNTELDRLRSAVAAGDVGAFESAYRSTIETCNTCHRASGHPFIRITVPAAPPVTNRVYEPAAAPRAGR